MQENIKCCLLRERETKKKKIQIELSIETFQFSLNLFFSHSQEVAQSLDTFPSFPPLPRSLSLSLSRAGHICSPFSEPIGIPVPDGPSSPEAIRKTFSCPFSVWTPWQNVERTLFVPFFTYVHASSGTSCCSSLLFFYFEVEFLRLCLSLSPQWLDANPSLTFSSFSTSYAPRLWNLSISNKPMMVRQTDDSTTATTARAVVLL